MTLYRAQEPAGPSQAWLPPRKASMGWYGLQASPGEVWLALVTHERTWPPLYGRPSGLYVWRALARAGVDRQLCYFTTSAKASASLAAELLDEVRPEKVLALGVVASQSLWRASVSHYALPRPRWRSDGFESYVSWLREIAH